MSIGVEIFFEDLKEEAQKRVMEAYGYQSAEEANWDTFPLVTLYPAER